MLLPPPTSGEERCVTTLITTAKETRWWDESSRCAASMPTYPSKVVINGRTRDPFLERSGNFSSPKANFEMKTLSDSYSYYNVSLKVQFVPLSFTF